ncbi:Terminase-like family protein [Bremerella volcania]|uniref:Terminase-like family protein n=2 Tax=Bremerella volcania TaxID=2527984 RepID=A0A518C895_9BACT|nr:Terminase-like family protein [Bremerella volcania]
MKKIQDNAIRDREIRLPKPLPHQRQLLLDPHRHKTAVCGRRWGKTGAGLPACVRGHGHPHPKHPQHLKGALNGGNIWWVAPTFVITQKIERDLVKCFQNSGFDYYKTDRRIELCTGGSITLKTAASPASLRGDGLDGIVYDEAAFGTESSWKEALRPAIADKKGWSLFLTSPNGPNWVKDRFDLALADPANYRSWQCPSSQNPLMTPEEMEATRLDIGDRAYQQEILAQFLDTEGAEFAGYYFQMPGFWFDEWPAEDEMLLRVLALDPSKGKSDKSDYTALVDCRLTRTGHVFVDAWLERLDLSRIAQRTVEVAAAAGPQGLVIESNQFQELLVIMIQPLARARGIDLRIYPCNNAENKTARIRSGLTPYLSRGELHFRNHSRGAKLLVQQLQQFPCGQHDDGPDALELGLRLLSHIVNGGGPTL